MKNKKMSGITLIALVITIVVLLILAGVTISMLTGENGIITQTEESKLETRGGEVEEKINLWKSENYSSKYIDTDVLTEEEMLQSLKDEKLVYEEEIDMENKIITIGTRKINYSIEEKIELQDDDLITELKTMILVYEIEDNEEVRLPVNTHDYEEKYNFEVDWGDGSEITKVNASNIDTEQYHTYQTGGKKEIKINGIFKDFIYSHVSYGSEQKLKQIKQWGVTGLEEVSIYKGNSYWSDLKIESIELPSKNSFKELQIFSLRDNENLLEISSNLFLGATNLKEVSFSDIVITKIPDKLFETNVNLENVTFYNISITEIPDKLFKTNIKLNYVDFSNTNITNIPDKLFETNVNLGEVHFSDTPITEIPENLFSNCVNLRVLYEAFARCENLTSISSKLFEKCDKIECFIRTFYECTSLTGNSTELYKRGTNSEENEYKGNPDGEGCYYGCIQLEDYEQIPEYWKQQEEEDNVT